MNISSRIPDGFSQRDGTAKRLARHGQRLSLLVLGLFAASEAMAATVYVSTAGSDTTGRRDDSRYPFKTVTKAINVALAGDTIRVASGEYQERVTTSKRLTFRGTGAWMQIGWKPADGPGGPGGGDPCPAGNLAPVISGLENRLLVPWGVNNACAFLPAHVTDDGFPNPPGQVTKMWSANHVGVSFDNPASEGSRVCFSEPGDYTLTLVADDGGPCGRTTGYLQVRVEQRARFFLQEGVPWGTCGSQIITAQFAITSQHPTRPIWAKVRILTPSGGNVGGLPTASTSIITLAPKGYYLLPCGGGGEILEAGFATAASTQSTSMSSRTALQDEGAPETTMGPRLTLQSCGCDRGGGPGLDLMLQGSPEVMYRIDASDNLESWTTLTNRPGADGPVRIEDPLAGVTSRFYRVSEEPGRPANQ